MIQIGITSENYRYESMAYKKLLDEKFKGQNIRFIPLLKTIDTDYQNARRVVRFLKAELKNTAFKAVIVCRDLDGLPSEEVKMRNRNDWFSAIYKEIDSCECLFYLAIYEAESIILGDIKGFAEWCGKGISISFKSNPLYKEDPKGFSKEKSKSKYQESKIAEVCEKLNVETILSTHTGQYSFKELVNKIQDILPPQ